MCRLLLWYNIWFCNISVVIYQKSVIAVNHQISITTDQSFKLFLDCIDLLCFSTVARFDAILTLLFYSSGDSLLVSDGLQWLEASLETSTEKVNTYYSSRKLRFIFLRLWCKQYLWRITIHHHARWARNKACCARIF